MSLDNDGAVATDVGLRGIVHEINNANNIAVLNISLFGRVIADLLPLLNEYDSLHPGSRLGNLPLPMVRNELPSMVASLESATERIRLATMKIRSVVPRAPDLHD